MLTTPGYVTLYVDGFGVEIRAERLKETAWKNGDSVCRADLYAVLYPDE